MLPSIGIGALPSDNDPICTLPFQTPPITSCGRPEGEQAADFNLYDIDGDAFNLESALLLGKPVLMISSSYTCPVFRDKVPVINDVVANYGSQLTTIIVYTPEAHPYQDISPYFGAVNTGQTNINAGILYEQPETYGERKAVLQAMLDSMQIDAPIYLDGPCNEWWNYYGPQPNNAYLIDTDGSIFRHHDWLHRNDDDIYCDIDSLLGLPTNCGQTFGGSFTVQLMSNDTIWGDAGTTITGHALLTNPTSIDCLVRIVKLQVNMPSGWTSSLCADVCYLPDVDTALVELPANSTMDFYYYFYTTGAGTGFTRVGFRNESDFNNGFQRNFWAVASEANGIDETRDTRSWWLAPNPAQSIITIVGDANIDGLQITDMQGREVVRLYGRSNDLSMLARGVYLVKPLRQGEVIGAARRLVKE
ncbi:MAG: T9SS type A sorting domain-containing protein [Flavobacteriales bacterium]|nr:T9SS type A sorting domain-containing protein [Flavobacteriales bacterium]